MRTVLEVLKEAEGPLTVNEIARRTFERRGKAVTQAELRPYVASLTGTLNRWNGKHVVCQGERPKRWSLER
jgi:hypothetical protein